MYQQLKTGARVLHCPDNVGNNAKLLSDHEKKTGIDSWSISLRKDTFGFNADQTLVSSGSFFWGELARWKLLWIAARHFDVVHFNNGKTIMPHRIPFESIKKRTNTVTAILYSIYSFILEGADLRILRALGKEMYATYQGSDARFSAHYTERHRPEVLSELNRDYLSSVADLFKERRIARIEKYAAAIYCLNPDLLKNFSSKAQFVPYYNVDVSKVTPHSIFDDDIIHIVHAPSKRDIKGSKYIVKAVENIKKSNSRIQFTMVENMSNKDARKIYDKADLFIDQLIVGWYGGAAVELMARGVPTMCYIDSTATDSEGTLNRVLSNLPIIKTSIETIEHDLSTLLKQDRTVLKEAGENSRLFVEAIHRI